MFYISYFSSLRQASVHHREHFINSKCYEFKLWMNILHCLWQALEKHEQSLLLRYESLRGFDIILSNTFILFLLFSGQGPIVVSTVLLFQGAHGRLSLLGRALVGCAVVVRDLPRHQVQLGFTRTGLEGVLRPIWAEGGCLRVLLSLVDDGELRGQGALPGRQVPGITAC